MYKHHPHLSLSGDSNWLPRLNLWLHRVESGISTRTKGPVGNMMLGSPAAVIHHYVVLVGRRVDTVGDPEVPLGLDL